MRVTLFWIPASDSNGGGGVGGVAQNSLYFLWVCHVHHSSNARITLLALLVCDDVAELLQSIRHVHPHWPRLCCVVAATCSIFLYSVCSLLIDIWFILTKKFYCIDILKLTYLCLFFSLSFFEYFILIDILIFSGTKFQLPTDKTKSYQEKNSISTRWQSKNEMNTMYDRKIETNK